nr:pilus assembly protein PilM [Lysinibacillus timonensis]
MFKPKKKTSHISIEINDYVLRALVMKGSSFEQANVYEKELPNGIVVEASIEDDMELYSIMKEFTSKMGKKQSVRFFVPDPNVLLKTFDHPVDIERAKLNEYVQMELGHTIHLPFQDPLVDVYDPEEFDGHAMLFAAAPEEVHKLTDLFLDIDLDPEVADIRALCNLRLLDHMQYLDPDKTYLISNWLINELSICIFSNRSVDFLRYQPINTDLSQWNSSYLSLSEIEFSLTENHIEDYRMTLTDQVLELDRIMNFFRFSLHKGEKSVDEIVVMGDNPFLVQIHEILQGNFPIPVNIINDELIHQHFPGFKAKHASLLGLSLKVV